MGTKPAEEFATNKYVLEQIDSAAVYVGTESRDQFRDEMGQRLLANADDGMEPLAFDSPLEAAFWVWWMAFKKVDCYADGLHLSRHCSVEVGGQTFVLDFVVLPTNSRLRPADRVWPDWPQVGVELDGHAFHEKTLEQVERRNQRDRALQQAGCRIFHFSFFEFSGQASSCLIELVDYMRERELEILKQRPRTDTQS